MAEDNLMEKLKKYMQVSGGNSYFIANTECFCSVCKCIRFSAEPSSVKDKLLKLAEDVYLTQYRVESSAEFYERMKKKYPASRQ
ncbi:MAG: hypothetical protein QW666_02605 [Candidatus Woesearchaeota archaeon]